MHYHIMDGGVNGCDKFDEANGGCRFFVKAVRVEVAVGEFGFLKVKVWWFKKIRI